MISIWRFVTILIMVFLVGWLSSALYSHSYELSEIPDAIFGNEQASPKDRIKEEQIHVYEDMVVIELQNPNWSMYEDTNSMDPILDSGVNGIELVPTGPEDLQVGDIVAYESSFSDDGILIVHRIVHIDEDEAGWYAILKGDNNATVDPEKVRFNQIEYVLVGIIY